MLYRTHEGGPLTEITIEPGAVIVTMTFDRPGDFTEGHRHAFDHDMEVKSGRFLMLLDGVPSVVEAGRRVTVPAGALHGGRALALDTVVRCVHRHADIHPDKTDGEGIPLEWLTRLTIPRQAHVGG